MTRQHAPLPGGPFVDVGLEVTGGRGPVVFAKDSPPIFWSSPPHLRI
ncbi:MAG: hypothetical protein VYE73_10020 [Acidobacteriota bacterium]|nr:hypothetical protein [Acidobacteriota bacterium]